MRFLERRVDALICVHGRGPGAALDRYMAAGIPVIGLISKSDGYSRLPLVGPSLAAASAEAAARLKALGHSGVGIVWRDQPRGLLTQFMRAAEQGGLTVVEHPADAGSNDPDTFLKALMASPAPPTVLVANQVEAARLLEAADHLRIQHPARAVHHRHSRPHPERAGDAAWPVDDPSRALSASGAEGSRHPQGLARGQDIALTKDRRVEAGAWIRTRNHRPAPEPLNPGRIAATADSILSRGGARVAPRTEQDSPDRETPRMTTQDIANDLVALWRQGQFAESGEKYWADDVVSVEAGGPGGMDPVSRGKDAARGKGEWWAGCP